jgi:hypothetical protein
MALVYVQGIPESQLYTALEALSSCAIGGNRLAEICSATLNRILRGEGVGERYILGLAWALRDLEKAEPAPDPFKGITRMTLSSRPVAKKKKPKPQPGDLKLRNSRWYSWETQKARSPSGKVEGTIVNSRGGYRYQWEFVREATPAEITADRVEKREARTAKLSHQTHA